MEKKSSDRFGSFGGLFHVPLFVFSKLLGSFGKNAIFSGVGAEPTGEGSCGWVEATDIRDQYALSGWVRRVGVGANRFVCCGWAGRCVCESFSQHRRDNGRHRQNPHTEYLWDRRLWYRATGVRNGPASADCAEPTRLSGVFG